MTLNQRITLFGSVATIVVAIIGIWTSTSSYSTNTHFKNSTVNIGGSIGQQTNIYENQTEPSFENLRAPDLQDLTGKALIEKWFELMNTKQWKDGCSLMSKDKCDIQNGADILDHSREPRVKTVNGYQNIEVWHSLSAPQDTWCVKYTYQERQSIVFRDIIFVMQYKLSLRSDDGEEIASRLCEKKWASGLGERRPCGDAIASINYCL